MADQALRTSETLILFSSSTSPSVISFDHLILIFSVEFRFVFGILYVFFGRVLYVKALRIFQAQLPMICSRSLINMAKSSMSSFLETAGLAALSFLMVSCILLMYVLFWGQSFYFCLNELLPRCYLGSFFSVVNFYFSYFLTLV